MTSPEATHRAFEVAALIDDDLVVLPTNPQEIPLSHPRVRVLGPALGPISQTPCVVVADVGTPLSWLQHAVSAGLPVVAPHDVYDPASTWP